MSKQNSGRRIKTGDDGTEYMRLSQVCFCVLLLVMTYHIHLTSIILLSLSLTLNKFMNWSNMSGGIISYAVYLCLLIGILSENY